MNQLDTRPRILFVDDEEGNLKAFKSTFRRDMTVFLASSGQEALELLAKEEVHIIISDQRMPGMSGSEFLAEARNRHPKAMRMLLTGYADLEAVVRAVNEGGIYAYATKPWDENDLRLRIKQAFEIQQLRESKEGLLQQYRQIFEASGDPIVLVDHRGRILDANQACAKLLDTTVEELMNSRFGDFLEDPSTLVRSLRARRSGNAFINVDLTLKAGNERIIDCLMTATYLGRNALGANVFQAMIKDVTDRKQEENRLRKLNADLDKRVNARTSQLLEALEDIGSFSYTVAHDLRSPLKTMAVMSEHLALLNVGQGSPVESHELAERIQRGAQRMLELVDDLLRFSQTNKRELDRREIDLALLAQEVIEDLGVEGRKDQITLEMEQGATVMADAPMLKVVLQNLLSNAVKFTRAIPQPRIVVGHRRDGERDLLFVKDNGVGFDTKQQEQVFLVFKRLHTQDQFEGSGVGLAIVKRVVSKHGGEVWAESAPGLGTTINVVLPRQELAQGMPPFIKVA